LTINTSSTPCCTENATVSTVTLTKSDDILLHSLQGGSLSPTG
jgi:hypothetical protein